MTPFQLISLLYPLSFPNLTTFSFDTAALREQITEIGDVQYISHGTPFVLANLKNSFDSDVSSPKSINCTTITKAYSFRCLKLVITI